MKNKKIIGLMSVLLATGLIAACSPGGNASTSKAPDPTTVPSGTSTTDPGTSSTTPVVKKFTVRFLVDGNEIKSYEVEEGKTVTYDGDTPTKEGDKDSPRYEFTGWDRDLTLPIVADTDINAEFKTFDFEVPVDNFEDYTSAGDLADAGWKAYAYKNDAWTTDTGAKLRVSSNSLQGEKALGFDVWRNNMAFKAEKEFTVGSIAKEANAFRFSLMVPRQFYEVNVYFTVPMQVQGQLVEANFKRAIVTKSSERITEEYVDYVIPFSDPNWILWDNTDSIDNFAAYYGIDPDTVPSLVGKVGFSVKAEEVSANSDCYVFFDNVGFANVADDAKVTETENYRIYDRYTMNSTFGAIKLDITYQDMSAVATVLANNSTVEGNIELLDNRGITFTSKDGGATLKYTGLLTNGNQAIKFVKAEGSLAAVVTDQNMYAVQVVDNFEQYEGSGTAYYQGNTDVSKISGMRGAYYSEYRNDSMTTTSPWGSSNSNLMGGDGNQMNLKTDGGHSGTKYGSYKISQYNGMRYINWDIFDKTADKNSYRGATLSFWAKSTQKVKIMLSFFCQYAPTFATRQSRVKTFSQSSSAVIPEWTHYELALDTNQTYYGFMLYLDANWTADGAFHLDDVEVYTVSPYKAA